MPQSNGGGVEIIFSVPGILKRIEYLQISALWFVLNFVVLGDREV